MAYSYENVRLVIADSGQMVRSGLKAAMFSFGFRTINDTGSFVKLHDLLKQDAIDLLVTSSELENNEVGYLIQEMRHHRLGNNPFVVVIILVASGEPDYVRKVIDSGCDDLLLMPVSPDQLKTRVEKLTLARKPFVVTHDYIGPDRRTKARTFEHQAPMLQAPNPLKARVVGGIDTTRLMVQLRDASTSLNRMKIERHAAQAEWLVNHIGGTLRDGEVERAGLVAYTSKLVATAEDMLRRMQGTASEIHAGMVGQLLEIARKADSHPAEISFTEIETVTGLAQLVNRTLGSRS